MPGICGRRADGDPLNCAANTEAQAPDACLAAALQATCPTLWSEQKGADGRYCCTAEQVENIASSTEKVAPFVVGCPACYHNFVHFWCVVTCHLDQATFSNVTVVQQANDTRATAVAEVDFWVDAEFGTAMFDSCKDVKFGAANTPAMSFIGGGATNYQAWLDFLGLLKDKRPMPVGSPFQQNFYRAGNDTNDTHTRPDDFSGALSGSMVGCGDNALRCSCSDCPVAPGCAPPSPDDDAGDDHRGCHVGALSCFEFGMVFVYAALAAALVLAFTPPKPPTPPGGCDDTSAGRTPSLPTSSSPAPPRVPGRATASGSGGLLAPLLQADDKLLAPRGSAGSASSAARALLTRLRGSLRDCGGVGGGGPGGGAAADADDIHESNPLDDRHTHYPPVERALQGAYYRLGLLCARFPLHVLATSLLLISTCCVGCVWFRVETDPQMLWVGPGSQAAVDKAAYEAAFGPFYRITQLLVTTTAGTESQFITPDGRPAILTRASIEALFDMHDAIAALEAPLPGDGANATTTVRLEDVCYKPFGDACAVTSVAQFWGMDRSMYEQQGTGPSGRMRPEYCFAHWYTECRSNFMAPIDPKLVLGGFPADAPSFRNYTADATTFVVTFPLSSRQGDRAASEAWEAAFLALAAGPLSQVAATANLSIAYSCERSVQDELERESASDAPTIAFSYLAMMAYITLALGSLPARGRPLMEIFVFSRASLGFGGVIIVASSVAGALGIVSALGLWCTLIIMEVIPFLVLAVGVDNMFVLAHALQRQASGPLQERVASALASCGPSITLAATCEVAAFGLGYYLTRMPAVRNFSLAAAIAVGLDFLLQVTAFVSLLTLDTARLEARRLDCIPCTLLGGIGAGGGGGGGRPRGGGGAGGRGRNYGGTIDDRLIGEVGALTPPDWEAPLLPGGEAAAVEPELQEAGMSAPESTLQLCLHWYMHKLHIPALLSRGVQLGVLLLFLTGLCLSIVAVPHLSVGLDQAVALPRDSYLQRYYTTVLNDIRVGPPLLLVVNNLNVSHASSDVGAVCSVSGCQPNSVLNQVAEAARTPHATRIATGAASWLDDFISWLSPSLPKCCRTHDHPPSPPGLWGVAPHGGGGGDAPLDALASASDDGSVLFSGSTPFSEIPFSDGGDIPSSLGGAGDGGGDGYSNSGSNSDSDGSSNGDSSSSNSNGNSDSSSSSGSVGYCPPPDQPPCTGGAPGACDDCAACVAVAFEDGRPSEAQFAQFLPWFLEAMPSEQCAKAGAGAYTDAVSRTPDGSVAGLSDRGMIAASAFRAYYTPLNKQEDFIAAVRSTRALVSDLKSSLCLDVYAYSMFHVFFEQYLTVYADGAALVGAPLLVIFFVVWALGGSVGGAALLTATLTSLLLHLCGAMLLAGIQLNAVSLVNLAMALGIAVEFCAHVVHAFGVASGSRARRMAAALERTGASVLSGITLTKLVGVAVLAFAQTQIFEVYYFRLYAALVVLGAAHGLVLLPVLLLLAGPPSWADQAGK